MGVFRISDEPAANIIWNESVADNESPLGVIARDHSLLDATQIRRMTCASGLERDGGGGLMTGAVKATVHKWDTQAWKEWSMVGALCFAIAVIVYLCVIPLSLIWAISDRIWNGP